MTNITAGTRTPGQALASESALYAIHSLGFVSLFCYVLCNSRGGGGEGEGEGHVVCEACTERRRKRRNGGSQISDFLLNDFSVVPPVTGTAGGEVTRYRYSKEVQGQ